jgi:hypothetical protein
MAACKRGRDGRLHGEKWRGRGSDWHGSEERDGVGHEAHVGEGPARCVNDGDGSGLSNA